MHILGKLIITPALALSMLVMPAQTVLADRASDNFAKALLLGLGVAAIAGGMNNNRQPSRTPAQPAKPRAPAKPAAEIQADKDMQESLNYFGFDAGPVDGRPGRKTREAVATFQSSLNNPTTGVATDYERSVLRDALARARSNPQEAMQLAAGNPLGQRGLPSVYRDMAMGRMPAQAAQIAPAPVVQPQPTPVAEPAPAAQVMTPTDDGGFDAPTAPARSANELCSQTANYTSANGGLATSENMTDPTLALNEQFCLARGLATSEGKQMADSVNASQEKITAKCTNLKNMLAAQLADYGTRKPADVIAAVAGALKAKAWSDSTSRTTGRICLGEGYRVDDAEMATAAAATLAASGQKPYAEVIGHNLREGLGTTANPQASKAWLTYAMDALKAGDAPAFLPGQSEERMAVLSAALAGP